MFCDPTGYLDAWDAGRRHLDRERPARVQTASAGLSGDGADASADADPRAARLRSITYRRSELDLIPEPGWLVEGFIQRASLSLLSGKFGTYKSFVSIAVAASVATGVPFLDMPVADRGPVIYVAAEGASGLRARLGAWEQAHLGGARIPDDMFVVVGGAVRLLSPPDIAGLEELCKQVGPRLVVWDTLHRCAPGLDEDASQESGTVIEVLAGLREQFGATQFINHHTGHGGVRARGSSAWEDDMDGSWVIKLAGDGEDRSAANQRTLEHRKIKDGELSEKIPIGLHVGEESAYVDRLTVQSGQSATARRWIVATDYARRLDGAGVPLHVGRNIIARELKELGVPHLDNNVGTAIAAIRKAPGYQPGPTSADVCLPS